MRSREDLRKDQLEAIGFLSRRKKAGLLQDMGGGKTASALTSILELRRFGIGPVLVVGPIRVIETVWKAEAEQWKHLQDLTFSLIRGNVAQRKNAIAKKADIYLTNPEQLFWVLKILDRPPYPFEVLMIDESSKFKSPGSKRFRVLRYKLRHFERRYIFTGTFAPNSLLNIWSQVFILDLGKRLGRAFENFKYRFFQPVGEDLSTWVPIKGAEQKIYHLISDIVFRLSLPKTTKPTFNYVNVTLPPEARRIYDEFEALALTKLRSEKVLTAVNAGAGLMKCRQIANGVTYVGEHREVEVIHEEKLKAVQEIVEETGSPVIIVYNFRHELALLEKALKGRTTATLSKSKNPVQLIEDWNAGKIDVLFLHPASGGHGLNIQFGGHTMIWFALTFSYEDFIQTVARLDRPGQTFPVMVHIIMSLGTVDQLIEAVQKRKAKGQNALLESLTEYTRKRKQYETYNGDS